MKNGEKAAQSKDQKKAAKGSKPTGRHCRHEQAVAGKYEERTVEIEYGRGFRRMKVGDRYFYLMDSEALRSGPSYFLGETQHVPNPSPRPPGRFWRNLCSVVLVACFGCATMACVVMPVLNLADSAYVETVLLPLVRISGVLLMVSLASPAVVGLKKLLRLLVR